ncbi:hypothetical protein J7M02_05655 [Candidatus Aerophobetes bacterium]|nr:hypothetical protein [Candidatus Aerophobetes bacterium]
MKNKRSIKVSLNGKTYLMMLRKEKGVRKDYLMLLLPQNLEARVSKKVIEIIPTDIQGDKDAKCEMPIL